MTHTVTVSTLEPPAQLDVSMMQAATFSAEYRWLNNGVAQSLAGYSARMSVGLKRGRPPILTVTSDAGEIAIEPDGRTGIVAVTIPAAKTSLLTKSGRYDLLVIDPSGVVTRLAEGAVTLDGAVTPVTVVPAADVGTALVVFGTPADGLVPVWSAANGRFEYGSPADVDVPDVDPPDVDVPVPSPTVDDAGKVVQVGNAGAYELDVPDFYGKQSYATVGRIVGNPTDVVVGGLDYAAAMAAAAAVPNWDGQPVQLDFDEAAACIVGDVAYWVSGWCRWDCRAIVNGASTNVYLRSDYLPYILRYDLANDRWLPSVKIPAPAGAPAVSQSMRDADAAARLADVPDRIISGGQVYAGTHFVAVSSMWLGKTFPATSSALPKIAGFDVYLLHARGWLGDFNPPDPALIVAGSDGPHAGGTWVTPDSDPQADWEVFLINGPHQPTDAEMQAWLDACPVDIKQWFVDNTMLSSTLPMDAELPQAMGWGFEGGYYGAIGTKVYFGGGDSNLYDPKIRLGDVPASDVPASPSWQQRTDGTWWYPLGTLTARSTLQPPDFIVTIPAGTGFTDAVQVWRFWESDDPLTSARGAATSDAYGGGGKAEWTADEANAGLDLELWANAAGAMHLGLVSPSQPPAGAGAGAHAGTVSIDTSWSNGAGRQLMSYDTVTGGFETLAPRPIGADYIPFGVADGKLYTWSVTYQTPATLAVYDPASDAWQATDVNDMYNAAPWYMGDWAQGVQVGRWFYWLDQGVKLNLDADPTMAAAWVEISLPPDAGLTGFDWDAGVALGADGKIHVFTSSALLGNIHLALDPANDTWELVDDGIAIRRFYFSAAQTPSGDWRFIGGGDDVQGEMHPLDPVMTEHSAVVPVAVDERLVALNSRLVVTDEVSGYVGQQLIMQSGGVVRAIPLVVEPGSGRYGEILVAIDLDGSGTASVYLQLFPMTTDALKPVPVKSPVIRFNRVDVSGQSGATAAFVKAGLIQPNFAQSYDLSLSVDPDQSAESADVTLDQPGQRFVVHTAGLYRVGYQDNPFG